jgi:hypothetical protein
MRFSIAYNEDGTVLTSSSGGEDAEKSQVIKTANEAATIATLVAPSPGPPRRIVRTAVAVAVVAVALAPLLLIAGSDTEANPIAPASAVVTPWAPAKPQQAALAPAAAEAGWNTGGVDRPTAYIEFCQNTPGLCGPRSPTPLPLGSSSSARTAQSFAPYRNPTDGETKC